MRHTVGIVACFLAWTSSMSIAQETLTLKGHKDKVFSVCFSPDGKRIVSGGVDGMVKVWDSVKGEEILCVKGHSDRVVSVCVSPDGRLVLALPGMDP